MFVEREGARLEATSQERRDAAQNEARVIGRVVRCDGARAIIAAYAEAQHGAGALWTVGRMITINLDGTRTVGLVYSIEKPDHLWAEDRDNLIEVSVELIGEVRDVEGRPVFDRGITIYPHIGAISHRIRARDLAAVYDLGGREAIAIGQLSQDASIDARIAVRDTLTRHFAVVGTTGVGKSTAVSLLLRKAVAARPDLRVLIMDPHNEFASTFPNQAVRINSRTLDLPFWLFRLEELVEVLYRSREPVIDEVELLRDLIPQAKHQFRGNTGGGIQVRRSSDGGGITADTPVPYRMHDVIRMIDERMGQLDSKAERPHYRALRMRIEAAVNDPRYRFMFQSGAIDDNIHETIGAIFRVPHGGKPITCLEMAGMPAEVINSVCSVLARLAFELAMWSGGKLELLLLCEEAHRYMPADPNLGFAPTRHALSRIAKEGRKYGCYLGVVTQRPGELDPTILSQCSTVFAMRLANDKDQDIIRAAIADSSASSLSFLSSMGQREAIAFGEGVAATMRMKFERIDPLLIPGSTEKDGIDTSTNIGNDIDLFEVVNRLRNVPKQEAVDVPLSHNALPRQSELSAPDRQFADPRRAPFHLDQRPPIQEEPGHRAGPRTQDEANLYGRRAYDPKPGLFRR